MNTNVSRSNKVSLVRPFVSACAASCKKLLGKIENVKRGLAQEFHQTFYSRGSMVRLALNEAEALAHETGFPLLVFPALAREKVEAVAAWNRRQWIVQHAVLQRRA